jgi:DNA polymerase elongation subunit (family B)
MNKLIFGKDLTQGVVSIEAEDDHVILYKETEFGITQEKRNYNPWFLRHSYNDDESVNLEGSLYFNTFKKYNSHTALKEAINNLRQSNQKYFNVKDDKERCLINKGITYFKGLKVNEVSVLSFDIETNGLTMDKNSKVYLISNTYKFNNKVVKKLFSVDDYPNQKEMINAWCKFVRDINPSIITGHNIISYDIPYLRNIQRHLNLGRNNTPAEFDRRPSFFRKDGSQVYEYKNIKIYGREIVDTFFLSIKYDIGRKYSSYSLKTIIAEEGLEKEGRQFYDAKSIKDNWDNPVERAKIKEYCKDDADDSLALYELMIPSFFYLNQSIPMPLQMIINRASGSQINSFMLRGYLQDNHSVPQATEVESYSGGISFGNPGIYDNVYKVDVASLYPSIMRQYRIYDKHKDPQGKFLQMVDYFTEERLNNKAKGKETGDRYYKDLEQSQKIMINSAYGFMGARGLNFNSPRNASRVTALGRAILGRGIRYAENQFCPIVNADTDSFSFVVNRPGFNFQWWIHCLNRCFKDKIVWEDDGFYDRVIVVKAKNYALKQGDSIKIKGSALKATMKEPALKEFLKDSIEVLLTGNFIGVPALYDNTAKEIANIKDITRWSSKKTITDKVLNPKRTNEQRVLDALHGKKVQEGDKVHMFFKTKTELSLAEDFNGEYDKDKLYEKLFKTVKVFENVLPIGDFLNYKLKKNVEKRP